MISKEEFKQKASVLIDKNEAELYKKKKKILKISLAVILPIYIAIFITVIFLATRTFFIIFMPSLAGIMLASLSFIYIGTRVNLNMYKEKYIYDILSFLLEGYKYEYDPKKLIPSYEFRESPFYSFYDNYEGEDLITINIPNDDGSPSDTTLSICDLDVTETHTDSDGDRHTNTVFSGCFGYIKFPFDFKCILGVNHTMPYQKNIKKLSLEDVKFNKKFNIYTDNQVEALVILTPSMMKKLEDFKNRTKGFEVVLYKNKMYFHVYNNMLEIKNPKKELTADIFDNIYEDVSNIISLVEEIKNNNKVFKM